MRLGIVVNVMNSDEAGATTYRLAAEAISRGHEVWIMSAGGRLRPAKLNDTMFELAETVRSRLAEDGMFFVGLDIVGDKLMEINVFNPGGLGSAQMFEKVNFTKAVLESLQRKVESRKDGGRGLGNVDLATL